MTFQPAACFTMVANLARRPWRERGGRGVTVASVDRQYDRGEKREHYQQIESLMDYVRVAQDRARVEVFSRAADGAWTHRVHERGEVAHIASLKLAFAVDELYASAGQQPLRRWRERDDRDEYGYAALGPRSRDSDYFASTIMRARLRPRGRGAMHAAACRAARGRRATPRASSPSSSGGAASRRRDLRDADA